MSVWAEWVDGECRAIEAAGRWRAPRTFDAAGPVGRLADGREVVSFASNDYLGLTQHPHVKAAALAAIERWGTGSGAARLVVGDRPVHHELEVALAAWRGTEATALFPTGYAANLGVLSTLAGVGTRVWSDELNHASIVDGCRLARERGARVEIYPHADVDTLARHLAKARSDDRGPAGGVGAATRDLVVTDAVFSMDGDVAPLDDLHELCRSSGALLVVDEAHAVLGPHLSPADDVVHVGTLSKALGALGGYVTARRRLVELVVNRARTSIFTTASSPADTAAALAALGVVASPEGDALRARLRSHISALVPRHPSPILPVVVGDERDALRASAALLDRGLLVPAIRPPTVPAGTSRLRIALSAAHTDEQVERLSEALAALVPSSR